jgi:CHAT domain-containing protein
MMPLPAAPEEARRIAQAVGGQAFIDGDATVERFTAALQTNRQVHIATHGRQDPAAPALQTLYLHSGRRQVVPYFALDVLRHQLDGLDLVTLSACETALGRIDINDNPRGLQAFLFMAGAATIVSCLWPVGDSVAALFFEQLYRSLAGGLPKLQAFGAAQRAVREQYPRRSDWGAFHYSGLWQQT